MRIQIYPNADRDADQDSDSYLMQIQMWIWIFPIYEHLFEYIGTQFMDLDFY
jgi:hypothetical protein